MLVCRSIARRAFTAFSIVAGLLTASSCSDTSGPAAAVTLTLYSVDGVAVPAQLTSFEGRRVNLARGFLQGTNWGHACGFAAGLAEGPLTTVAVPACRLHAGEERTFDIQFNDSRFPSGTHTYRFVPD
jgi:hypothetical protein